jgi:mRNA-degrading endonuclease toxin of MazEF toxin-antitoxin module
MPGKCVRGAILDISLDPTVGHEIWKTRLCLVVQNDIGNQYSSMKVVVPVEGAGAYPQTLSGERFHSARKGRLAEGQRRIVQPDSLRQRGTVWEDL